MNKTRRQVLTLSSVVTAAATLPNQWVRPIVNTIVLPAHAQTSMCMTDTTVGGPLIGNPSQSTTCQAACEAEAAEQNAQLCDVNETTTSAGVECACDLDLP